MNAAIFNGQFGNDIISSNKLMKRIAIGGNFDMMRWAFPDEESWSSPKLMFVANGAADQSLINHLVTQWYIHPSIIIKNIVNNNDDRYIIDFLEKNWVDTGNFNNEMLHHVIRSGKKTLLLYILQHYIFSISASAVLGQIRAMKTADFEIFMLLLDTIPPKERTIEFYDEMLLRVVINGWLPETVKLLELGATDINSAVMAANNDISFPIFKYLVERYNVPVTEKIVEDYIWYQENSPENISYLLRRIVPPVDLYHFYLKSIYCHNTLITIWFTVNYPQMVDERYYDIVASLLGYSSIPVLLYLFKNGRMQLTQMPKKVLPYLTGFITSDFTVPLSNS